MFMKVKKSIQKRFLRALLLLVICGIGITALITEITIHILKQRSGEIMRTSTLDSANLYVKSRLYMVDDQLGDIVNNIELCAQYMEYCYEHPERLNGEEIALVRDLEEKGPQDKPEMYYETFEESEEKDEAVLEELKIMSGVEPFFEIAMEKYPSIESIYVTTNTHINIVYDCTAYLKSDIHGYNPEKLQKLWYILPMQTGEPYVSDAYEDSFGRGIMVTISVPYYVEDNIRGVVVADIQIDDVATMILDNGFIIDGSKQILLGEDGDIFCCENKKPGDSAIELLGSEGEKIMADLLENKDGHCKTNVDGKEYYAVYNCSSKSDLKLIVFIPRDAVMKPNNALAQRITWANLVLIIASVLVIAVAVMAGVALSKRIAGPIIALSNKIGEISGDNFDYVSEINTQDEVELLSVKFQDMVERLKKYVSDMMHITAEQQRIGTELRVANEIQQSYLPSKFPAFPGRNEIDIYAYSLPAKEVGGDFYDFFFIDPEHLCLVIADVSGKGVGAAMFMMTSKTFINSAAHFDTSPASILAEVNNRLCENNKAEMFVTAWIGILDVKTGIITASNAGHEYPFIIKSDGSSELLKDKHGMSLGAMENVKYSEYEIKLNKGEALFVYTDGIAEAGDSNKTLFGTERIKEALNKCGKEDMEHIVKGVMDEVEKFVKDEPQFDDTTMLCIRYLGADGS